MKKLFFYSSAILLSLGLAACGSDDDTVNNPAPEQQQDTQENNNNNNTDTTNGTNPDTTQQENADKAGEIQFAEFELDVDYGMTNSYEANYDYNNGTMEAEIDDNRKGKDNRNLKGDEAYTELRPLLEQLTFDQSVPEDEVIKQVLDVFGLDKDYTDFELEVVYPDATEKEYKHNQ